MITKKIYDIMKKYNILKGKSAMAIEKVREYFKQYGIEDRILEFDVSSATVELAAQAIGCEPEKIAKSMTFNVNG